MTPRRSRRHLERALAQRATVVELIADDLYGPQRLLAGGHLPTRAIMASSAYLRSCIDIASPGAHRLTMYAADVATDADGQLVVLADHTEAPALVGFTTAHGASRRTAAAWRSAFAWALGDLASPRADQPTAIALQSAGEDEAAAAAALAFTAMVDVPLVTADALTISEGGVWWNGAPVDVVLRLAGSTECDGLEIRPAGGRNGLVGLVESCRRGRVAIANPLGWGIGESPAVLSYIGKLTRTLLGEDPLIESAPSWWCGESAERSHVLAHLDDLTIRTVDGASVDGRRLSATQRTTLTDRIAAMPHRFVAHAAVAPETAVTTAMLTRSTNGFTMLSSGERTTNAQVTALEVAETDRSASPGPTNAQAS